MIDILYHCTKETLQPDGIVSPGNWGKRLMEIGPLHKCWKREIVLEAVRIEQYPHKPSRLKGTFACESLDVIKCYQSKNCPCGFIYEVIVIKENALRHKGDFNALEPLPRLSYNMWEIAMLYWTHGQKTSVQEWPGIECSEILTDSSLKVVRKVM